MKKGNNEILVEVMQVEEKLIKYKLEMLKKQNSDAKKRISVKKEVLNSLNSLEKVRG